MVNLRKTCISGGVFWGYETLVDIDEIETLEDIKNKTITNLKSDLNRLKLVELVNNVDPRVFHIHSTNLGDIFTREPHFVIYVCNNC
jgi:hypothetical protein